MPYYRFDVLQKRINDKYYKSPRNIYSDFKTFVDCPKIPQAHAIDFTRTILPLWDGGELNIYDMGVGSGAYSLGFLDSLADILGHDHAVFKSLNYFLCDISFRLNPAVEEGMKRYNVHKLEKDVTRSVQFMKDPYYVRSGEMYDDLPARVLTHTDSGEVLEVLYDSKMRPKVDKAAKIPEELRLLMNSFPSGYHIPINTECSKNMLAVCEKLKPGCYFDFSDYGFSTSGEISVLSHEEFNSSIIRTYGGQPTIDVNFIYLMQEARTAGLRNACIPQKDYVEGALNQRLYYVELEQLFYMTLEELEENEKRIRKFGYAVDEFKQGIEELDDYKHMRVCSRRNV